MINNDILNKFYFKYCVAQDENEVSESYKKRMLEDPDFAAKQKERSAAAVKAYYARQKENPSPQFTERLKGINEAARALRKSDSLEGLIRLLGEKIATYKHEIKKAGIKKNIDPTRALEIYARDSADLYYLRDKLTEFTRGLNFTAPGLPLQTDSQSNIDDMLSLLNDMQNKYGQRYLAIGKMIPDILDKVSHVEVNEVSVY
ncbi:hypothetical protein UFOVP1290_260 [uncultured Caudovirales phage]|uniref:Uncharacterized protein n=1 Tax=uncultured Caudovirales phage TaxID=2100421 RepID=A0A6J5RGQ9_9CAUD|nr:hypothetical protein UFOVP1290_260 [uncultured Caudovirales phage]